MSRFLRSVIVAVISGLIGLIAGGAGVLVSVGQYTQKVQDHEAMLGELKQSTQQLREFVAAQSQVNSNTAEILERLSAYHEPRTNRR